MILRLLDCSSSVVGCIERAGRASSPLQREKSAGSCGSARSFPCDRARLHARRDELDDHILVQWLGAVASLVGGRRTSCRSERGLYHSLEWAGARADECRRRAATHGTGGRIGRVGSLSALPRQAQRSSLGVRRRPRWLRHAADSARLAAITCTELPMISASPAARAMAASAASTSSSGTVSDSSSALLVSGTYVAPRYTGRCRGVYPTVIRC